MRTVRMLMERDLPRLITSSSISSSSTSGSTTNTVSSVSSVSPSASSSFTTLITPPSAHNNPFIERSGNAPNGTVFIAVGSIMGLILLIVAACWLFSAIASSRQTKRATQELWQSQYYDGNYKEYSADDEEFQARFESPRGRAPAGNASLFISPTRDLNTHQNYNESPFKDIPKDHMSRPDRTASPERKPRNSPTKESYYHQRNKSSISLMAPGPSSPWRNRSPSPSPNKARHAKTPSKYLDDVVNGLDMSSPTAL